MISTEVLITIVQALMETEPMKWVIQKMQADRQRFDERERLTKREPKREIYHGIPDVRA